MEVTATKIVDTLISNRSISTTPTIHKIPLIPPEAVKKFSYNGDWVF